MSDITEADVAAICSTYRHFVASGRFREWSELFTKDGYLVRQGVEIGPGPARLYDFIVTENYGKTRVPFVSPSIIAPSTDGVTAVTDFVVFGRVGDGYVIERVGRYDDEVVVEDGRPRLRRRVISYL